ncbi:CYTH and CHAD domain-containing protein [Herminiimonas sp.]|uniref:CYTH and CHAD domain-containing protein n=1 Tax=Herminiimonas sp. TaxID=1926289 RepID=UPI00272109C6|nr:CYTH and CHAD domain-containing protein [Herminiimonas sp.]MDO8305784.1 CHAD domain-containing protein [Herminiimonas sp.]
MEVELKLLIDTHHIPLFKKHPLIKKYAQSSPVEQEQMAIYFDTPSHALRRCGAGLRIRQAENVWTQTLKAGGSVASGLHQRHEWESILHSPEPDLYALRKMIKAHGAWDELIASLKNADQLCPIFTTTIQRTIWQLRLPTGDEIECVLDQGNVNNSARSEVISEIELELKSGSPLHIFDFALELLKKVPLRIGNQSKAERGYALNMQQQSAAVKAESLVLSKKMTINQAFEAIIENCLQQIQANEAGVVKADNIDSLHQMRVGLRRLRSALDLFQEVIAAPNDLRQELDWLSQAISEARDWDVLATKTLELVKIDDAEVDVEGLRRAALSKAAELHRVAAEAIDSVRYTHFALSFSRWLKSSDWREAHPRLKGKDIEKRLKLFSKDTLKHDQQRLKKRGRQFQEADSHARHRVRIAAKKMHYDTEFFQSLYASKETKEYIAALSDLQDKLGLLNDITVGDGLLMEIQKDQSELSSVSNFIRGYLAARAAEDEQKVKKLWKKFKSKHLPK